DVCSSDLGGAGQRQGIGGNEVLTLAQPDHHGRTLARTHDTMRFVAAKDGNRVGTLQAAHCLLQGLEEVAIVEMIHQVGDHFRVGLALELVANVDQFGAKLVVILDDAVMNQCNACRTALTGKVWVSVVRSRSAMRRPSSM